MGCFSTCFRKSKRRRSRKPTNPTPCSDQFWQRYECVEAVQPANVKEQEINPNPDSIDDEQKEKLSVSGRKKVTFYSTVQFYEELPPTNEIHAKEEEEKKESNCSSDSSSSSTQIPLPNTYRYHNCRDSDDDEFADEMVSDDDISDIDYMGDDEDEESENEVNNDHPLVESDDSKLAISNSSPIPLKDGKITDEIKSFDSVLHPVENLSHWKEIKAKAKLEPKNDAKENKISDLGCGIRSQTKSKNSCQEIAVDASLSSWLTTTPSKSKSRANSVSVVNSSPCSERNYSAKDFEDRPILGVLTVEEIREFSATSTPRRSPARSPDDMPIIGSVGSYWN